MSGVHQGFTLWFTGLSGAGKSTLAEAVRDVIRARGGRVEILDGDEVRTNLSKGLGFSKEDPDTNIRRIGYVARLLSRNGVAAITAAISPYRDVRGEVRTARISGYPPAQRSRVGGAVARSDHRLARAEGAAVAVATGAVRV